MIYKEFDGLVLESSGEVLFRSSSEFTDEELSSVLIPQSLMKAVDSRKIEFQKGRFLTKKLLSTLGCYEDVLIGPNRGPLWPEGFVGSISHTRDYYIAIVSVLENISAVGIDIEEIGRVKPELCKVIRTEGDVIDCYLSIDQLNTLIFSAKESLYKMLNPKVNKFFGFKDAAVINVSGNSFSIKLKTKLSEKHCSGSVYNGRFICTENYLVSYIEI